MSKADIKWLTASRAISPTKVTPGFDSKMKCAVFEFPDYWAITYQEQMKFARCVCQG